MATPGTSLFPTMTSVGLEEAGLSQTLPKLANEGALQKMLADERMRCETHKTNYQTLKAEHTKIQDDYRRLQRDLEQTKEESAAMEGRFQSLMARASKELAEKITELEEVKTQAITPEKLEVMKVHIAESLEEPFRERFNKVEEELEHYRTEYNKLRYEHSFLKSEYEHETTEHKRVVEEMKLQYETEIENLHKDKEAIVAKFSQDNSHDGQRVRTLQRDNAQLHLKVKGLLTELEEIRVQREQTGLQSDHVSRLQARQLTEHVATIKALEAEKESLKLHIDQLESDMASAMDGQRAMSTKAHDAEKRTMELRGQLEEAEHRRKMEVTELKMEMVRSRGELERERDVMANELEGCQSNLEILKKASEMQAQAVGEREKEAGRRIQAAREEEWEKINRLEQHNLELEARLHEFDKLKIEEESQRHAEREKWEEQVKSANQRRDQTEKDMLALRARIDHRNTLAEDLEKQQSQCNDLQQQLQQTTMELHSLQAAEQELSTENDRLKTTTGMMRDEVRAARAEAERTVEVAHAKLEQHKVALGDERRQAERRVEELETEIRAGHQRAEEVAKMHRKKKRKYQKVVDRLNEKVQLLEAKKEELKLEKQALRNKIPKETYAKAVQRLRDLQRRHTEFRSLLAGANATLPLIDVTGPVDASTPFARVAVEQERLHHEDLTLIRRRLDDLNENQKLQMDALLGEAPLSSRTDILSPRSDEDKEN
ncbi:centrosomal protein of 83 kDa-like [Patiria miniata]|uniref:Centrosomal protein of 83 kDa n=1 Tax=Patiria miniata TaxID=46514 RepID=A0A914AE46_PATMI|nr:centrosomal protein of 83 kDa-like [Patiria miniata]XP_038061634.1 centrosomal protein of 83 kDa-like [Patiria miniata]